MIFIRRFRFFFSVGLIIFASTISYAQQPLQNRLSNEVIDYYFDMVLSGNYESACGLWESSSLARAERLGIEYENIGVKIDCTSPVIYDRDRLRKSIAQGVHSVAVIDSQVLRWKFNADVDSTGRAAITQFYYTAKTNGYFWLITPQDYYARDWDIHTSRYFRFYISPTREQYYNDIAAESLDRFVDKIAQELSISAERLKILEDMKIDYYLCRSANEVDQLSGKRERGIYDPATDAIITSVMPHYHKVALLLVNFKLQKLPLFTVPALQQGLAAYLGGRWQRSPEVVTDFGAYILKYGILDVDSLFESTESEDQNNGDISSPVAACLAEYLWTKLGRERFFDLYRSLSGDYRYVLGLSTDNIENQIAEATGQDWDTLKTDFIAYATDSNKTTHGSIRPGEIQAERELINEDGLIISASPQWLKIEYTAGKDEDPSVSVLFDSVSEMEGKISMLFREQFPKDTAHGLYRYGIKLDKNEIGLYDYASNLIVAKYVASFSSNTDYYDPSAHKVTAYMDINLLHGILPGEGEYSIIK